MATDIYQIAYMDETGHAADDAQRFCGMAGFIATVDNWQVFEEQWNRVLTEHGVGYMHMREFVPSRKEFRDWKDQTDKDKFYRELLKILRDIKAIPFGSIISLDGFRKLSAVDRELFNEPYLRSLSDCVGIPAFVLQNEPQEVKYRVVFSEQTEFKHRASVVYELFRNLYKIGDRMSYPEFGDMKTVVPLQAADIVAYELNREFRRQLETPTKPQEYGYKQIERMAYKTMPFRPFFFQTEFHIRSFLSELKSEFKVLGLSSANISETWRETYALHNEKNQRNRGR